MMTTKGSPRVFKKGAYLVRPELREAVDQLLRKMVPTSQLGPLQLRF